MKGSTKKQNPKKKHRKTYRKGGGKTYRKGGRQVREQLMANVQTAHGSDWPSVQLYSINTGTYPDIVSKYFGDSIHKVEYALSSIMLYENIYLMGLKRPFFKNLVWLGQKLPLHLSDEKKSESVLDQEREFLIQLHNDPNYKKELEIWLQWYEDNISIPTQNVDEILQDLNDCLVENKKPVAQMNKLSLEIAKFARISWYKNYRLNDGAKVVATPIVIQTEDRE